MFGLKKFITLFRADADPNGGTGYNGRTFEIGSQGDNADGVAVQTLGHLKAVEHGFNGTAWDRQRGSDVSQRRQAWMFIY